MHAATARHPSTLPEATGPHVGPITPRLIYTLALLPIVPSLAGVVYFALEPMLLAGMKDELQYYHLLLAVMMTAGVIFIWRKVVLWTAGRRWLTALVSLIPFAQVVYAQPLWNVSGCGSDDLLRVGQEQVSVGLWIWICVWIWWAMEKLKMSSKAPVSDGNGPRMSPIGKRILASIATLPFLFGVFLISDVALGDAALGSYELPCAMTISAAVAIATWLIIWRGIVNWNPQTRVMVHISAAICFGVPLAMQWFFANKSMNDFLGAVLLMSPVIGWGVWMALTIAWWPLRPEACGAATPSPTCLSCGYSLIGLYATRCPECGDERTLDELWRASTQPEV